MSTKRFLNSDRTALYFLAALVILVAFILIGGGSWVKGLGHGSGPVSLGQLQWLQILVSLGLGFLVGWLVFRRK